MTTTELATIPAENPAGALVALAAQLLTGLHLVDGVFVRTTAIVNADGWITWDIVRYHFSTGPDETVRVQFHPTAPVPVADSSESA